MDHHLRDKKVVGVFIAVFVRLRGKNACKLLSDEQAYDFNVELLSHT
jgi:hypothetical protein